MNGNQRDELMESLAELRREQEKGAGICLSRACPVFLLPQHRPSDWRLAEKPVALVYGEHGRRPFAEAHDPATGFPAYWRLKLVAEIPD